MNKNKRINKPLMSVLIVNWNGMEWLPNCLSSLRKQDYGNFEIILVDNASTDGSVKYVKKNYPNIIVVENNRNLGFAGGNNVGLKFALGKYILLLNNDTRLEKNYLKNFIKAFDDVPNLGCAQSKIILMNEPKKLDSCGSFWTSSTFLYHYGLGKDQSLEKYNKPMPFFSNKGASMLIRRDLIDKIGLFDDDFWCYYEETDFCHRVWMSGYECWYYPEAVLYHVMGVSSYKIDHALIQFHNFKNKLLSFLKNLELKSLLTIIPVFIFINIMLSIIWLFQGKFRYSMALYKAIWWNIKELPATLRKRKKVQKLRKKSDKEIFKVTKINPSIRYYKYLLKGDFAGFEDKNYFKN